MKIAAVAASGWLMVLAGCGLAANPQPPSLWLPQPVRDLSAERAGSSVLLHWTMPRHTTDKLELKGPQRARFCWMQPQVGVPATFSEKRCHGDGGGSFQPNAPAEFTAALPPQLTQGAAGAVAFFVELENPSGKSAGPSNAAWAAAGSAPPPAAGLAAEAAPEGVVLHWTAEPPASGMVMRIHRVLIAPAKATGAAENQGVAPPQTQVLEVSLGRDDPGGAVDRDAALDHVYRYTVQRVQRVTVEGRMLELAGTPSEAVTIDAKDVFPPAVPSGLAAVADRQTRTIDLSWSPDTEPDLAGYIVYRRDLSTGTPWQRISGSAPVVPPSFEDRHAAAGRRYAYSVSAIDQDGNESARSAPVAEELPQ